MAPNSTPYVTLVSSHRHSPLSLYSRERERDGKVKKKVQAVADEGARGAAEEKAQRIQARLLPPSEAPHLAGAARAGLSPLMGHRRLRHLKLQVLRLRFQP
ncbi:hypothetical protein TB1_035091 [Malus domestica]